MTTVVPCVLHKGTIKPLNQDRIAKWKAEHTDGQVFDMILDDGESIAMTPMARKYFAIRDDYAAVNGYSKDYAHVELKHLYGVTYPADAPIPGRLMRLVDAYGEKEWQVSITDYNKEELARLVSGADMALMEASV